MTTTAEAKNILDPDMARAEYEKLLAKMTDEEIEDELELAQDYLEGLIEARDTFDNAIEGTETDIAFIKFEAYKRDII